MVLKEIISRSTNGEITQEESLFVIKQCIKIRKNVDVEPIIRKGMMGLFQPHDIQMMKVLTDRALDWFIKTEYNNK